MEATVLQDIFSKALSIASRFSGGKVQLPVLANVLISAKGNKITLSATNLETSVIVNIGAKVKNEGEITIPSKVIFEIISNLPSGPIELKSEEEKLSISTSDYNSEVLGMNASDFPKIPSAIGKNAYSMSSEDLFDAIQKVLFSISNDETRPVLTGVLLILKKGEVTFVSTDGFRLSQKRVKNQENIEEEQKIIIPKSVLFELSKLASEDKDIKFSFDKNENQIVFLAGEYVLSSRIIQGEFPDFERIIPKETLISVEADKDELSRAIKLASVFAKDSANITKLTLNKDNIEISAESSQSGNQKIKVDSKMVKGKDSSEKFLIAYNYRFLEEFLNVCGGDSVIMEFSDPSAPGLFLDPTDKNYLHIIMPVRITT